MRSTAMMYSPTPNANSRRPLRSLSPPPEQVIDQLKRTNGHQTEFLTRLSHELRNPLAPMHHALQLLRMQSNAPVIDRTCAVMQRQLSHLVKLIDELLDLERINQGKLSLSRQRVVLQEILQGAVEIAAAAVRDRGHHLQLDLPQAPIYLEVDPVRMTQVVANLLINAAKYTPPSGRIELRAHRQDEVFVIEVQDNGVGLHSDELTRIFDLYAQVAGHRHMAEGGLGVGLALAQKVIELHGGSITARSAGPGQGSTFSIRLPLTQASAQEHGSTSGSQSLPSTGRAPVGRILIVDDNVDGADTLASALNCLGHEACACYDGPQALQQARHLRPQAALLDLTMPDMDGFELARQLRAEHPHIRLAAMTGWGAAGDRDRCLSNGFEAHILKPASIEEIESVLDRLVQGIVPQPPAPAQDSREASVSEPSGAGPVDAQTTRSSRSSAAPPAV